ncbi:MAG: hypothetical protein HY650_11650 [Acidobacteria bacterium]|nr:hypothetical protein [Acidobacteriota bacterium]
MRFKAAIFLLSTCLIVASTFSIGYSTVGRPPGIATAGTATNHSAADGEVEEGSRLAWARWFMQQRAFPSGTVPFQARERAIAHVRQVMRPDRAAGVNKLAAIPPWEPIGPNVVTNGQTRGGNAPVNGRVTALAIDPGAPNTIYAGTAGGGVWKTIDGGKSWRPLTDDQLTLAIGALAIDPADPKIIYAGTGEGNLSADSYLGVGLLKTTDAGVSWTQLGSSTFAGLSMADLVIDPTNSQVLYAGVTLGGAGVSSSTLSPVGIRGAYKSTDGGTSWRRLRGGLPGGTTLGVLDLAMDPADAQVLYATVRSVGVFKTTDGGTTWTRLTGGGFPDTGSFGRISIAVAPSHHLTLYAALEDPSTGDLLSLVKSTNGGTTWSELDRPTGSSLICQCIYDNVMAVSPTNPNVAYFGGVGFYRTTNGGMNWTDLSIASRIHVDVHAIVFDPGNPSRAFVGTDGGVWASSNGGSSWGNLNSNLAITQFNYIAPHPTDVKVLYGGTQDNGTVRYTGAPAWSQVRGGDGGAVLVDFQAPNTIYHTFYNLSFERSDNGGLTWVSRLNGIATDDRSLFYIPVAMDPSDSRTLYLGSYRLYKSSNRGDNWNAISPDLSRGGSGEISTVAVAPTSRTTIYVGTSDGGIQATTDGGTSWMSVREGVPGRYVSRLVVDGDDPKTVYAALSGFRSGHVFKTTDGGMTWKDISGNLPDIPANALALEHAEPGRLFVGTDIGVFVTADDGVTWEELNDGLPNAFVWDLQINERTQSLFAATHGRGVFRLPLRSTP